jgi:hypothetical protein
MAVVAQHRLDRRRGLRVTFLTVSGRPTITLGGETYEVVDLSPTGLRLRFHGAGRPTVGFSFDGMVFDAVGDGAPVSGRVMWVSSIEAGIMLDRRHLPVGFVMRLVAQERDRLEA